MIYDLPQRKFCPFCMLTVFTPNLLSPLSGTNSVIPAMITLGKITAIPSPLRIYIRSAPEHRKKLIRHLFRDKPAGYPCPLIRIIFGSIYIINSHKLQIMRPAQVKLSAGTDCRKIFELGKYCFPNLIIGKILNRLR